MPGIPNTPVRITVKGRGYVTWSDPAGKRFFLRDRCPHRAAPLSEGWVEPVDGVSCIRCPYHAWAFTGKGTIAHVPSETDARFPRRPVVRTLGDDVCELDGAALAHVTPGAIERATMFAKIRRALRFGF